MGFLWVLVSGEINQSTNIRSKHYYSGNYSKRKGKSKNFAVAHAGLLMLNAGEQDCVMVLKLGKK